MWDLIVSVPDHCLSFYFKCFVSIIKPFALDLRGSKFGALIGFEPTVITQSQYGRIYQT